MRAERAAAVEIAVRRTDSKLVAIADYRDAELRAPVVDGDIVTGRPAGRDRRRAGDGEAGAKVVVLVTDDEAVVSPSSHQFMVLTTQPERVTETFLLPLRTVVASSSATRSSRSAQQSPPRSAALAGVALNANPPSIKPSAAAMAMRLDVFVSPPNMSISTFPDKLPNPNSRFEFASRHRFGRKPAMM